MSPHLDDRLVANILSYVTEIKASSSCQTWKEHLYDALKLEPQVKGFKNKTCNVDVGGQV